jgi:hypothetical protein
VYNKMAGVGFQFRAQIPNLIVADRGVYSADFQHEKANTADGRSQESKFESQKVFTVVANRGTQELAME